MRSHDNNSNEYFPLVSVVIPTLNRLHCLPRALDSVFSQTVYVDEVIVVDNGSTDNTVALIKNKYPDVTLLQQEKVGVSAARNMGIKRAKGNWIAFLDSDDAWCPTKLERQLTAHSESPCHRLIHTDEIWFRNGKRVNQLKKHQKYGGNIFLNCLSLCCISPSSVLIEKTLFQDIGYFDENLPACEDYDMWLRVCAREEVLYVNESLTIKHNDSWDQLSKKYWGMDRFRIASLENLLLETSLTPQQKIAALQILIKKVEIVVNGALKRNNQDIIYAYRPKLKKWEKLFHKEKLRPQEE